MCSLILTRKRMSFLNVSGNVFDLLAISSIESLKELVYGLCEWNHKS